MRFWFGRTPSDWTMEVAGDRSILATGSIPLTFWSSATGGFQYTDLLLEDGTVVSKIFSGNGTDLPLGTIPAFQGPDGVTKVWVDSGVGTRWVLPATNLGDAIDAHLSATDPHGDRAFINTKLDSRVSISGGSTITIPEGDTVTQALRIHLPTGDRSGAVDTLGVYLNNGTAAVPNWRRVSYVNEKGCFRVISPTDNDTPMRVKAASATQKALLQDWVDLDNKVLASVAPDGSLASLKNVSVGSVTPSLGGGAGVLALADTSSPPTANPVAGVVVYSVGGKLRFRTPNGEQENVTSDSTDTTAPTKPLIKYTRNYQVTTTDQNIMEFWTGPKLTGWINEWGGYRGTPAYNWDAAIRLVAHATQSGNIIEYQTNSRAQLLWGVAKDGATMRGNGVAPAVRMADVLVLNVGDTIPDGTPAGTVILRRTA
ncbi:hypothetical protein ACFVH6_25660 [Spirillospora sp. NPDC127200]